MKNKPELWSPKSGERGMTDLHYAAYCQNLSEVKRLVESGIDVNQKDDSGYTPLAWCIDMSATGKVGAAESIVDYLVEQGARLEFRDDRYADILEFAHACDYYVAAHIEDIMERRKRA
jgi:ankyrin repeat protein